MYTSFVRWVVFEKSIEFKFEFHVKFMLPEYVTRKNQNSFRPTNFSEDLQPAK